LPREATTVGEIRMPLAEAGERGLAHRDRPLPRLMLLVRVGERARAGLDLGGEV
jgi:hypothetical protein